MPSQSVTPFYLDKALWVSILAMFLPLLSAKLGVELDATKIAALVVTTLGYVVAHKTKSAKILLAEIQAAALSRVAVVHRPDPVKEK